MPDWERIKNNAAGQMNKLFGYGKEGLDAANEAVVLGEGKGTDIVDEPAKFMALMNEMMGGMSPMEKQAAEAAALAKALREG